MMDVLLGHLVINFAANFQVRSLIAAIEAVVTFKENLFRKAVLVDITLDNFKQSPVAACKTGASETDNDFSPMIHLYCLIEL